MVAKHYDRSKYHYDRVSETPRFPGEIHRKSPQIANYYGHSQLLRRSIFSTAGSFGWTKKTFQAGGGYKNLIKTRKTISTTEIFPLWPPLFFWAKKSSALKQGGECFLIPSPHSIFPKNHGNCRNDENLSCTRLRVPPVALHVSQLISWTLVLQV